MFAVFRQHLCRDNSDPSQNRENQRQFKRAAEDQQEFDVKVDIGADAQLRCDIPIHAEADEEVDDERKNDEVTKNQARDQTARPPAKQAECPSVALSGAAPAQRTSSTDRR